MLAGVKPMIVLFQAEDGIRDSVYERNGGRVDKRIRLESVRL